jgi:hypothetical protein
MQWRIEYHIAPNLQLSTTQGRFVSQSNSSCTGFTYCSKAVTVSDVYYIRIYICIYMYISPKKDRMVKVGVLTCTL